jgi:SAM-dependent methyltransferase
LGADGRGAGSREAITGGEAGSTIGNGRLAQSPDRSGETVSGHLLRRALASPATAVATLAARLPRGGGRRCVLCGHGVGAFLPFEDGTMPPLMAALGMIGSDVKNFACPWCFAHDRERHLFLYLSECGLMARMAGAEIVHFAPEARLAEKVAERGPRRYLRCDLVPASPEVTMADLQAMPFDDASFDLVIANHVLEHVDDDRAALAEIRRVLRIGGQAVLQTPFCAGLRGTWEDQAIVSPAARLQAYGQADHVRLFGADIFERIAAAGLSSQVAGHQEILGGFDSARYGVNAAEPLFLFQRVD